MSTPKWLRGEDPWAARMRQGAKIARVEATVTTGVSEAMSAYLDVCRGELLNLTAAAGDPPDVSGWPGERVWTDLAGRLIVPRLVLVWGAEFARYARAAVVSAARYRELYLQEVSDRLSPRKWPAGVFELVRAELAEAMSLGEGVDQMRDRLGDLLQLNAASRRLRARAAELRRIRDAAASSPAEVADARRELRSVYRGLDDADRQWYGDVRRIARTETMGALNGGAYSGARAWASASGERWWKQWLATDDERVRPTHHHADGQIVPIEDTFEVGGARLEFPGDPGGPAAEVIQCRCTPLFLDEEEAAGLLTGR